MHHRPAEWRKNKTIWLAWPFDESLWAEDLPGAQQEFVALTKALVNEQLVIIFPNLEELNKASVQMGERSNLALKVIPYGDIWLRDTLPLFVKDEQGQTKAVLPTFNGWGGKYLFDDDADLSTRVADVLLVQKIYTPLVFEGGAVESDGAGTFLTTEQCLLNHNRNPNLSREAIDDMLRENLGAKKVIWIREGLRNDHTDGHIDTIARFVSPQHIAIMVPTSKDDPNYDVLLAIKNQLEHETDAHGNRFQLIEIPSPGAIKNRQGKIMPASYLNFIMGDETFVVPLYGSPQDEEAVRIFSKHTALSVVGLPAINILTGGGAFHCISQEYYR